MLIIIIGNTIYAKYWDFFSRLAYLNLSAALIFIYLFYILINEVGDRLIPAHYGVILWSRVMCMNDFGAGTCNLS